MIHGDVNARDGKNTITNSGKIFGNINTGDAGTFLATGTPKQETIINSGTLDGGIFTGNGDRSITNSGIMFDLNTGTGNDTMINSKDMGNVLLGDGVNSLTNSGNIHGQFVSGIGADTVINKAGAVMNNGIDLGSGANIVDNFGYVHGNIAGSNYLAIRAGADADKLTIEATGVVYGNITLGDGTNTFINLVLSALTQVVSMVGTTAVLATMALPTKVI